MLQLGRQMGRTVAELERTMSAAELRDHIADMSLSAQDSQKAAQQHRQRPRKPRSRV